MALSPDQLEKKAAVTEAERIMLSHKRHSRVTSFYNRYKDPIDYVSTIMVTSTFIIGATAITQDLQINALQALSTDYAQQLAKFQSTSISLSGFSSLFAGEFIYNHFIKRSTTS